MDCGEDDKHVPMEISEPLVLGVGEIDLSKHIPSETVKHTLYPNMMTLRKTRNVP